MADNTEFPFESASWVEKGVDALVPGDVIKIVDYPVVKDEARPGRRGTYAPVIGPDGKPVHGERRTVARVTSLNPVLGHPNGAADPSQSSGFYRAVYADVLWSEGIDAHDVGAVTHFQQQNAVCKSRKTMRWALTGPNWPAPTTLRERNAEIASFAATAAAQRSTISAWGMLRGKLSTVCEELDDGRKPKDLLQILIPDDLLTDEREASVWVGKLWSGQMPLEDEMRLTLQTALDVILKRCKRVRSTRKLLDDAGIGPILEMCTPDDETERSFLKHWAPKGVDPDQWYDQLMAGDIELEDWAQLEITATLASLVETPIRQAA